jgi:hypothetical protein
MSCRRVVAFVLSWLAVVTVGCAQPPEGVPEPLAQVETAAYPWIAEWPEELPQLVPMAALFPAPQCTTRVAAADASFAAWLRGLPVRLDRSQVHAHNGWPLPSPSAAVVLLDLGAGDLQQCADTLVRLHAEFLWAMGRADGAAYHFTSGDASSWQRWVGGERFRPRGNGVERLAGAPRSNDHGTYRAWLQHLFIYAGTLSLALDSVPVPASDPIAPGDFFVDPGSPGHTVMVLDVVEGHDGARLGLIGQGFTPAQDLHVIEGHGDGVVDDVWFKLPVAADEVLDVPTWSPFARSTARRFVDPIE